MNNYSDDDDLIDMKKWEPYLLPFYLPQFAAVLCHPIAVVFNLVTILLFHHINIRRRTRLGQCTTTAVSNTMRACLLYNIDVCMVINFNCYYDLVLDS